MAATITKVFNGQIPSARERIVSYTVTGDGNYQTGGYSVSATSIGLVRVDAVFTNVSSGGYLGVWDGANSKLKVFYGDNNNTNDGPLIEVPNTTDLSAVTITILAFGV